MERYVNTSLVSRKLKFNHRIGMDIAYYVERDNVGHVCTSLEELDLEIFMHINFLLGLI